MNNINDIIKKRRTELNLTMCQVAKIVGVSECTISRWESGDIANMRRDKISLLAKALKISPGVIMGWEDYPKLSLTENEEKLITAYREQPQMQEAVNKLLGI